MYAPYFGLQKEPFSIAPDPRFLFMSEMHREALAHLLYGLGGGGGFVLLTGEIGAGKTTVCRAFLEQIPAHCAVAYVFNPRLSALELLQTVCDEFGVEVVARSGGDGGAAATVKDHVDALNRFLLAAHAQGRQGVLIIDEAQSLDAAVLEQLRLLTNLETHERKLLQIVLIGQPELRTLLARPELEQLGQRVIARYHLPALSAAETAQYVRHRLAVAGSTTQMPFDNAALTRIHRLSGGVPRRINLLCDRALLGAYAHGQPRVGRAGVDQAAREVFGGADGGGRSAARPAWGYWAWTGGVAAALLVAGWALLTRAPAPEGRLAAAPAASAAANSAANPAASAAPIAALAAVAQTATAPGSASAPAAVEDASTDPATLLAAATLREDEAWRALAPAWRADLTPGEACSVAPAAGLACFRSSGGLAVLRPLDRPSLLLLRQGEQARGYVQLVGLSATDATLRAGAQTWRLPLPVLAALWRGEFATLWRPPPGWPDASDTDFNGWLDAQLRSAGVPGNNGTGGVRAAGGLRERVLAFQVASGLPPDGLAGPMTLMRLGQAAGNTDEPRLGTR
jgi:general secretion pathway protein A